RVLFRSRNFALAFIFFQVATTAALATQVVLFEDSTAPALPISRLAGEKVGGPARATQHLLIQIDTGSNLRHRL
ncbi:hypothetical protein, partial [Mesorhizobium sp. M3A.F.Ca.ET.201.01.1.1]|uniref:hypothetical protein n=1 Tax=Mesorhizobium sp. M3A.F.Ca.ET.201.01.1.1 TaxID=2563946 RepID=UPI00167BF235